MAEPLKPRSPSRSPFDSQFPKEESHVRERRDARETTETGAPRSTTSSASVRAAAESVGERTARLERKMALAVAELRKLSPTDPRARLLSSAVLRRDEVLLDAVLAQSASEPPPPSRRPR
jgi:hypothetical protein